MRINGYLHFCKVSCSHRLWQIIFSCQLSHYDYYFFNNKLQIKIYLKLWHNMSIKLQLVWIIEFYHVFFISITMKCKIQVQRNAIILSQEAYLAHFWNTFSTWLLLLEILSVCDMTIDNILRVLFIGLELLFSLNPKTVDYQSPPVITMASTRTTTTFLHRWIDKKFHESWQECPDCMWLYKLVHPRNIFGSL